ncbi:MAG TPA: protein translocase subunit SecF [Thermodesulfobacteriota bacterium]|nr:protein translocase subunit SecF [Thermodesulfobacteriota bacterium]
MDIIKPGTYIDFVGKMKKAVFISWGLILIGIISFVYHKGPNWGVEFVGGTEVHIQFAKEIKSDQIRNILSSSGYTAEAVQQLGLPQDNDYLIRFSPKVIAFDKIQELQNKLEDLIKNVPEFQGASILRIDYIGPNVGRELIQKAVISVLLGCVGILLYLMIRFEFEYALGAVIAIVHDVLITLGAISIMDKEFTLAIVAALLTVIGYSVNDTIIIFDRIRENLRKATKIGFRQLVNEAVSQTLSRTILTGLTVFLVLAALFLLGGAVIHDFAFTLIVGVIVGTYSSIFVASAFVIYWKHRKGVLT